MRRSWTCALDPLFQAVFGDAALRPVWFAQMLQLAFVSTITGRYVDFTTAQHAALQMLAARRGLPIRDAAAGEIVGTLSLSWPRSASVPPVAQDLRQCVVSSSANE